MPNEENQEFETTRELETISDLNNQIIEVEEANKEVDNATLKSEINADTFFTPPTKVTLKDKIKNWWKKLNKKQKIMVLSGIIVFIFAIVLGVVLLIKNLTKEEEYVEPPEVIVQEENYRYENGVLIFLNNKKEEIGRYTCENQNENLCFVTYYSTEDLFDVEQKIYENNEKVKSRSSIILDTYVFINDNPKSEDTKIRLYNMKENRIENVYQLVKKVDANKTIVKNEEGLYGVIELNADSILTKIDFIYPYLGFIPNEKNYYVALQNEQNLIIDENGKNVSKAINDSIENFTETYIKALNNEGKYVVYNYNNQKIFDESYDYVALYNDYAVLINDNKMYLKFYDQNKLNEEAILLKNKNYVKTSVYDTNNVLKETRESFYLEENNGIISITIFDGNSSSIEVVNKNEGNLSKNLRNMNYFNGKIYIYSDTAKETLLGSYTCANKNNVGSKDKTLNNCKLAEDTIYEDNDYETPGKTGVIPLFNERFIFISDNPELVNENSKTIVLYDLKKNTSLGKYRSVNTYSYTGTEDITFSTVTDLQVVAENQNGNFGVIKINLTEVTGHIGFNYSSIERLKDYYVAKDANGYLLISKSNGASVTSAILYKIRNYTKEYVKVKNDGKYYIYDYQGKQINTAENEFKYIELYDDYFAGVDSNNQLGVYTYLHPEKNILSGNEQIQLNITNYYGNGVLAFKINGTEVLIGNSDKTYIPASQTIVLPEKEN